MKETEETRIIGIAIASLLIGAGLGVLFAPQSGRRTRKDIERWGRKTKDLVWDFQENLKENVNDLIEEITEVTRVHLEKGKEITEEKKKKVLEVIRSGEKIFSDQRERLDKLFKKSDA